jgi:hypothetical protein
MRKNCNTFRDWIYQRARQGDGMVFGVVVFTSGFQSIPRNRRNAPRFEVHSVRTCLRIGPDGQQQRDLVVEIVQRRAGYLSEETQQKVDSAKQPWAFTKKEAQELKRKQAPEPDFWFRGGCTLIIEPSTGTIRYAIYKSILSDSRLARQREFEARGGQFSLAATYFEPDQQNPFALLHSSELTKDIYGS